jgi:hypothetical protein
MERGLATRNTCSDRITRTNEIDWKRGRRVSGVFGFTGRCCSSADAETYKIGQHWTGGVAATELAMSSCDADCILVIERDRLERRPTSLWSFWI